ARAEVARVLDAVEHEHAHVAAAGDDELLEVGQRKLGLRHALGDDALMHGAAGGPIEVAAAHPLDVDAAGLELGDEGREPPARRIVEHERTYDRVRTALEHRTNRVHAVDTSCRHRLSRRDAAACRSPLPSTGTKSIFRSSTLTPASRTSSVSVRR